MKKILSLLLALTMVFALCGCGSRFLTQEEKEVIYEEVKQQKEAESTAENTEIEKPADESIAEKTEVADADEVVSGSDTEAVEDDFTVEEFEITEISNGFMCFKVKIRNNTDVDIGLFNYEYQLLDENGDSLYNGVHAGKNMFGGQSCWFSGSISEDNYKGAVTISFVSYYYYKDSSLGKGADGNAFFKNKAEFSLVDSNSLTNESSENTLSDSASRENKYISIDAICVDDSYRDSNNSTLRRVYLFYTVTAGEANLEIDSKTKLKIGGVNEYTSSSNLAAGKFIKNYYNDVNLKDVFVGTSQKVLAAFSIPEGDLTPGKAITLSDSQIPDIENISLSTDDIQHFDSIEEIAATVDPDGYKEMSYLREEADAEITQKVKNAINGHQHSGWISWFGIGTLSIKVKFDAPNKFTLTTNYKDTGGSGTYSVRNGYIFCTYDASGHTVEIPYELKDDGSVYMDVTEPFDVL